MDTLLAWDVAISQSLSNLFPHNEFFDMLFLFLSAQGLTVVVWGILFLIYLYKERLDGTSQSFFLSFILSFGTTAVVVNLILKNIFQRVRPWEALMLPELYCPSDFSFPSGHASGAFAGAVIFAHFDPKRSWLYYSLAIGISYSRIYLQCHYFLDVLFGALIGALIGFTTLAIMTKRRIIQDV